MDSYIRNSVTGRETTSLDGDFTFAGNVEVSGNLTNNGQPITGSGVSLEIPAGLINGSNVTFTFIGTPIEVKRNGVTLKPTTEVTIAGHVATLVAAPESPDWISGLVAS